LRAPDALAFGLALTIASVAATGVSAHRLDEYLQAARIALQPDGVLIDLDLTPGVAVADAVIAAIDHDRDGELSEDEQRAYADRIVRTLDVRLDEERLPLRVRSAAFPSVSALRLGEDTIRLQVGATHPSLSAGPHRLFFKNARPDAHVVYLANALVPQSASLSVTGQRRDREQRELTIAYAVRDESSRSALVSPLVGLTAMVLVLWLTRRTRAV
jgi:hypothetical protein